MLPTGTSTNIKNATMDQYVHTNQILSGGPEPAETASRIPCRKTTAPSVSHPPPVYWVNLDRSQERAKMMTQVLDSLGVTYHRRVRAFDGSKYSKIDTESLWIEGDTLRADIKSRMFKWDALGPKNPNQVACVASHLLAMHTAVHDTSPEAQASPYALILEDDVSFYFNTDFAGLIASAPSDFGILQLTVSLFYLNFEIWQSYERNSSCLWTPRPYDKNYFSLQAYIIKKEKVRAFVNNALTVLPVSKKRMKNQSKQQQHPRKYILTVKDLPNIWGPRKGSKLVVNPELVVYSGGRPTYVFNIPLIKSLELGMNTTIVGHNITYEKWHRKSDQFKDRLSKQLAAGTITEKLPSFLAPANRSACKS
jgi:GR25 family glycosyltransferase involved in LPS biosynthesis